MKDKVFLEKIFLLFLENGAKTLTMDDISREFSISKKTLYRDYKNKEELLQEVLRFSSEQLFDVMKKHAEDEKYNAIEKIMFRDNVFKEVSLEKKGIFFRQLRKYYPEIYKAHTLRIYDEVKEILLHNIEEGQKKELYKQDFDKENYIKYLMILIFSFDDVYFFENIMGQGESSECFFEGVLVFYLKAIVTEKGNQILEQIKNKKQKDEK